MSLSNSANIFLHKNEKFYCYALSVLLLAASAFLVINSINAYSNSLKQPPSPAITSSEDAPRASPKRSLGEYQIIAERNIFSVIKLQPQPAAPAAPIEPPPTVKSIATLSLVGTIISPDNNLKIAVIQDSATNKDAFYHEGDTVGSVLILKIMWNGVLINNNQRQEILSMKSDSDRQQTGRETESRPARTPSSSRRTRQAAPAR